MNLPFIHCFDSGEDWQGVRLALLSQPSRDCGKQFSIGVCEKKPGDKLVHELVADRKFEIGHPLGDRVDLFKRMI